MREGADVAPVDVVGAVSKVLVAQRLEAIKHRVDLGLVGDEGVEGGAVVGAVAHGGLLRW